MDKKYIDILFKEINKALKKEEVPVAALIVDDNGKIIAKAHNTRESKFNTINHAEILCISKANKRTKSKILDKTTLYVTLEPCDMCKTVIKEARIKNVYYLLKRNDFKKPYSKTNFELIHNVNECKLKYKTILGDFFKKRR